MSWLFPLLANVLLNLTSVEGMTWVSLIVSGIVLTGILLDPVIDQVVLCFAGNMDVLIVKRYLEEAHGDDN